MSSQNQQLSSLVVPDKETAEAIQALRVIVFKMKKTNTYKGIKISSNWDCIKSFQWMVENARFVFTHLSSGGERLKLVVHEPIIDKFDCFEIGNDRYGVITKADTQFSSGWGGMIEDSSKEIIPFIKDYLIRQGASGFVSNK